MSDYYNDSWEDDGRQQQQAPQQPASVRPTLNANAAAFNPNARSYVPSFGPSAGAPPRQVAPPGFAPGFAPSGFVPGFVPGATFAQPNQYANMQQPYQHGPGYAPYNQQGVPTQYTPTPTSLPEPAPTLASVRISPVPAPAPAPTPAAPIAVKSISITPTVSNPPVPATTTAASAPSKPATPAPAAAPASTPAQTPASVSKPEPASTPSTDIAALSSSTQNVSIEDDEDDYPLSLTQDTGKEHVNIIFMGHVDAGKSTIGGHLLFLTGMVDKRTLEKYENDAKAQGMGSWYLSWALDTNPEERAKGKTVEVGRAWFETEKKRYTLLDAPGHKSYVPNMIGGAAQADIGVLVISAKKGEFESGFEKSGQTREHVMLAKTAGVRRLIVVINKMDEPTVNWAQERYDEIVGKLSPFIKAAGFSSKDLSFMPVSGYTGANLKDPVTKDVCPWLPNPQSLLQYLDGLPKIERATDQPLRLPVTEKYKDMGTIVSGKLEAGYIKLGQKLLIMPNQHRCEVASISVDEDEVQLAKCGDNVRLRLKNCEEEDLSIGFVLCHPRAPVKTARVFEAQLAILEHRNIITSGFKAVLHIHTCVEEVTIQSLLHLIDKKTGKKSKQPPVFVKPGQSCIVRLETDGLICIETYNDYPQLGRFTLRDEGKTVAMGKVLKLIPLTESETTTNNTNNASASSSAASASSSSSA